MKKIITILMILCLFPLIPVKADDSQSTDVVYTITAEVTYIYPSGDKVIVHQKVDTLLEEPEHPDMEGFVFDGWYKGDEKWDFENDHVKEHMELEARYIRTSEEFTVTLDDDGEITEIQVERGDVLPEPEHKEKEGYEFDGWYNGDEPWDFNTPITEDIDLKAKYTKIHKVTVKDGTTKTVEVRDGEKLPSQTHRNIQEYDFDAWYIEGTETKWNFNLPVSSDMTIEARYVLHKYEITIKDDGNITTVKVESGKKMSEPIPKGKEGYVFDGWYLGTKKWDFNDTITKDMTLEAKYKKKYTVIIDDGKNPYDIEVVEGDKIPKLTDIIKPGYKFDGWYDETTGKKWNFDDPVTGDVKLKPRFLEIFTVIFDNEGKKTEVSVVDGDKVKEPEHSKKDDYHFEGWYDENDHKWNFNDAVKKNMKLTAKYRKMSDAEKKAREFIETGSDYQMFMAGAIFVSALFCITAINRKKKHI